jgi:glycosyltransferase involved in cell wall biosynthesis
VSVSVVMPVYNHRDFVLDAIRSVFRQTCAPDELIIIDDGSTDGSAALVRDFLAANSAPKNLSVVFETRENRGAHVTINEGVRRARGDFIAILNSDDLYMPNRIERCLETARAQNSRILFTYVEGIDATGEPLPAGDHWRIWYNHVTLLNIQDHDCISQTLLYGNFAVSTGNFFVHRSMFEEVGYFNDLRYCHDWDFLFRACLIEEPVVLREKLYKYRVHGNNTAMEPDNFATEEATVVTHNHLRRVFSKRPKNRWADITNEHRFFFGGTRWLGVVGPAFDGFLEKPAVEPSAAAEPPIVPLTRAAVAGKHVTILSHEMTYTGAPTIVRELARSFAEKGVGVSVVTQIDGPLRREFERLGFRVHVVRPSHRLQRRFDRLHLQVEKKKRGWRFAKVRREIVRAISSAWNAARLLKATRKTSGVLLINSFASWPVGLKLLKRWRGPAFWYIHETYEPQVMMPHAKENERLKQFHASGRVKMLYGSDATRALWKNSGYDGAVRYWSGIRASVSADRSQPVSDKKRRVILSVGTAGGRKGTRHLIEAFAIGRREGLIPGDVELCIVGCHPPSWHAQTRDLILRVHQPDLFGFVRLTHIVEPAALAGYFDEADVYVQSSLMEGVPIALLTAMSRGLPIVTTDVDGCKEAIVDGESGLLVPPRQEAAMAFAMARVVADQELAMRLGAAAREQFAERFSLEATFEPIFRTLFP